jgi:hypothetical protein
MDKTELLDELLRITAARGAKKGAIPFFDVVSVVVVWCQCSTRIEPIRAQFEDEADAAAEVRALRKLKHKSVLCSECGKLRRVANAIGEPLAEGSKSSATVRRRQAEALAEAIFAKLEAP